MIFGTSGIRGIYGKEITEELAFKVGNAFAADDVAVAWDIRESSPSLAEAVASGVIAKGRDAIELGIVPTPTLAFATMKSVKRGIMLTASHNPPEYNGLKLFEKGQEISKTDEKKIEDAVKKGPLYAEKAGRKQEMNGIVEEHLSLIKNLVDVKTRIKVVVDCNGAAAIATPHLLREMGAHVVSMNAELSGFNRGGEPNEQNLSHIMAAVPAVGADIGIAHDGDGDRAIIIDEKGNMLGLDVQLAIIAEHELEHNKRKTVVSTIEGSLLLRERIDAAGGKLIVTPVGSRNVATEMKRHGAVFGGEPCGEYIFSDATNCPDGILTAAKFLEILLSKGPLSKLRKCYKTYPMIREKFRSRKKYEVVNEVSKKIDVKGKKSTQDGVRVDEEDGWFLVRASGTEPVVRLTAEYKNKEKLKKRVRELRLLIENTIKRVGLL